MGRWELAKLVGRERAVSLQAAVQLTGASRVVASRGFQALLRAGLVVRERAAADGRQWVFRLSETGAAVVQMGLLMEG